MIEIKNTLKKAAKIIKKEKAKRIAIQIPEGLKTKAREIANYLERETAANILLFIDPCYGACDVRDEEAKRANCELLIHIGHRQFIEKHAIKTFYLDVESTFDKKKINKGIEKITKILKKLKLKKVAICSNVYETNVAEYITKKLRKEGIESINAGFVLGCNLLNLNRISKKVDAILYYGDDNFYALGIAKLDKQLFVMRSNGTIEKIDSIAEKMERIRFANIAKAKDAKNFAILLSSKRGQLKLKEAIHIKKILERNGKNAIMLISDFIRPEYLVGIDVDAYIVVACPRIIDDSKLFRKPLLLPEDLKFILQ